jgi:hypothetical protein
MACEIKAGTDGVYRGWFQYLDYLGEPITDAGLRMDSTGGNEGEGCYSMPNGLGGLEYVSHVPGAIIKDTVVTQAGGQLGCWGERTENFGHWLDIGRFYQKPGASACDCSAQFYVRVTHTDSTAWALACDSTPEWLRRYRTQLANLTDAERAAILAQLPELPDSGFNYSTSLVQQIGVASAGTVEEKASFTPGNVVDPDILFLQAYPYMYSFIVTTAVPADFGDKVFEASVVSDAAPDGIPVEIRMVASNEEGTVHVLRTSYFKPVEESIFDPDLLEVPVYDWWTPEPGVDPNDPNTYEMPDWEDPNSPPPVPSDYPMDTKDPNFIVDGMYDPDRVEPCVFVPIAVDDSGMRIRIELTPLNLLQYSDSWLTDDKNTDFNGDGIVNLADITLAGQ